MASEPAQLVALDLVGISVFALSGALAAVRRNLDVFGVIVLATVTALGGGMLRDVLLGQTPPHALREWPYLATPLVAALIAFRWHPHLLRITGAVLVLDAAGLGLFTITGTSQALDAHLNFAGATLIGVLTGIGGGMLRDVVLQEVPVVLNRDIYALAAVAGAILICLGAALHVLGPHRSAPHAAVIAWDVAAVAVVFGIRMIALRRRWSPPYPTRVQKPEA